MRYIKLYEQAQPEKSVKYYTDGSVKYEEWSQNGERHREDGPAYIEYYQDGSIGYEEWYQSGKEHREDGPAYIEYYQDGSVASEAWWFEGKQARDITSLEDFSAWQYLNSVGLV